MLTILPLTPGGRISHLEESLSPGQYTGELYPQTDAATDYLGQTMEVNTWTPTNT